MPAFTSDQRRAIELRGNVLVVAGAGTGKTRTLVQRCVQWLLEPGTNSLDQILMVTFTEAAAAEVRQRIRSELKNRLLAEPQQTQLLEQAALLDTAFISTLHSFCLRLVRHHFYELELDPQLTVLPAEEARLLAEETLSRMLEAHYAGKTPVAGAVQHLIHILGRGNEFPIRRLVFQLHEYTQTLPDPTAWFTSQVENFSRKQPRQWQEWLGQEAADWAEASLAELDAITPALPVVQQCLKILRSLPATPSREQWHAVLEQIQSARLPWPKGTAKSLREHIEQFFQDAQFLQGLMGPSVIPEEAFQTGGANWTGAATVVSRENDALAQDWEWMRHEIITLLELTTEFGREFDQAKRELGAVDFHDLEQLSLRLLWDARAQRPTALAEHWRERLRLVFVDEYQDINRAQDAILRALAREDQSGNRFLVGDPKQSIYRFRLADPHIFQNYTTTWTRHPQQGTVVALTDNFRSHEAILHFVNQLFEGLMRREIGGVEYDSLARLRFGDREHRKEFSIQRQGEGSRDAATGSSAAEWPSAGNCSPPPIELHLQILENNEQDAPEEDDSEAEPIANLTTVEKEARLVGLRLNELRARRECVWDSEAQSHRPIDWKDMVILLRSPRGKVEGYAKVFNRLGIPLLTTRGGFFESQEITDLLNLLTVLDNPLQDIPLLAVLRSPLVGMSLDELGLVRLARKGRFWTALKHFHRLLAANLPGPCPSAEQAAQTSDTQREPIPTPDSDESGGAPTEEAPALDSRLQAVLNDPTLRATAQAAWQRVDCFLRQAAEWRHLARQVSLSQCLDRILQETQYATLLLALPRGRQQQGNVTQLLSRCRQFDQFQGQGLFRFLKFVEAQKSAGIDREPAPPETANAVRLMSIHQSKGLEFNVVVLADLGKPFNLRDLRGDVILDEELGLCPRIKPPFTEQRYPSLPYWMAQRRQRKETLGEEMRLLYVALTRACQRLILAGSTSRAALGRWAENVGKSPASRQLLSARSYLDWLGPWLPQVTGTIDWATHAEGCGPWLRWKLSEDRNSSLPEAAPAEADESGKTRAEPKIDGARIDDLVQRLNWRYPFAESATQPAKLSVSTLRAGVLAMEDEAAAWPKRPFPKPSRKSESTLSAAEIGTAHHAFLQAVSLDCVLDRNQLEAEAIRLEKANLITASERSALDLDAIAAFWLSIAGQAILTHREEVHREMPFSIRLGLGELLAFQRRYRIPSGGEAAGGKPPIPENDFVVLTGVADLVVLLPNEIWCLDFKTDAVTPAEWKTRVHEYEPQLQLYALALQRVYQLPVTRCWLHSLPLRQTLTFAVPEPPRPQNAPLTS
jgi:ATP-dependent helicase/nuclease subunit A